MKKLLIVIITSLFAVSAHAQLYVGGNIGLPSGRDGTGIGINIAPELGYYINDHFNVGGFLSYQSRYNTFGVTPYFRWNIVAFADRLRLFLSATAPMRFTGEYQSYGFNFRPGFSVFLGNGLSLMAHIGTFGYAYTKYATYSTSGWLARVDGDSISVGVCVDLGWR